MRELPARHRQLVPLRDGKGSAMREILSLATYLILWFICDQVIGFESGLLSLVISLGAAIGVFVLLAMRDRSFYDEDDDE